MRETIPIMDDYGLIYISRLRNNITSATQHRLREVMECRNWLKNSKLFIAQSTALQLSEYVNSGFVN